jgi:hypothetical protein
MRFAALPVLTAVPLRFSQTTPADPAWRIPDWALGVDPVLALASSLLVFAALAQEPTGCMVC